MRRKRGRQINADKILSGVYPYGTYEGTILYDGKELKLRAQAIHQAIEEGIAIVYQELTLVPDMTVGENIYLGKEPAEHGSINWDKLYADTQQILTKYRLDIQPQAMVKYLGVGKMQMTEIAKALSENARVLILDEPTSALPKPKSTSSWKSCGRSKSMGSRASTSATKSKNFSASAIRSRSCGTARW